MVKGGAAATLASVRFHPRCPDAACRSALKQDAEAEKELLELHLCRTSGTEDAEENDK